MSRSPSSRRWIAGLAASVVVATPLSILGTLAPAHAAPVDIQILNINDFHGRIDANTTKVATTIEALRATNPTGTVVLSAGDNIGASLFASAVAQDKPTIDVLNALDVTASAVGNHEFDAGTRDLMDRVIPAAEFDYLGANVYAKGTTNPVLKEYSISTVNGVDVAVIGVVTATTPSAVAPDGVATVDFGDPVVAVNRVAAQLTDGNAANGEADVIVAEYHDGASDGQAESTLAAEVAKGGVFADIVTKTSPAVDAIFTAHTHKLYAWDAPVPGAATTRPVVQSNSYGTHVGQVTLTVDSATGDVSAYTKANVARAGAEDLTHPRVAAVKTITDAALAHAAVVGNQPVGQITQDITTAFRGGAYGPDGYRGGSRDDHQAESTLGDLVANALRDGAKRFAPVDLGLANPGGLRAELIYAGDTSTNPANTDGVVTFAEANSVLPFNNTVATVKLTGASLKAVLEQQWQDMPGADPTKPYYTLGLSDNVEVTLDESKASGSRITSVRINGQVLDPAKTYTIATLSFLAAGGDNFSELKKGEMLDTGLLDAQMFRDYLAAHKPLSPDFARQQVHAKDLPTTLVAGVPAKFQLGRPAGDTVVPVSGTTLDMTSLGSPVNTSVTATLVHGATRTKLNEYAVKDGVADVDLTVPMSAPSGSVVELVAAPTKTRVTLPVQAAPATTLSSSITPSRVVVDRTQAIVAVSVTRADKAPATNGSVTIRDGQEALGTAAVVDGVARVQLPRFRTVGTRRLTATYSGGTSTDAVADIELRVVKARAGISPAKVTRKRVKGARFTVKVGAEGKRANGRIKVKLKGNNKWVTLRLRQGKAVIRLQRLTKGQRKWFAGPRHRKVIVRYLGNAKTQSTRRVIRLTVKRR